MEIITGNKHDLKLLIEGAYQRIRSSGNNIEKYALIDYLNQLHELHTAITGEKSIFDSDKALISNSQQRRYVKYIDSLYARLEDEFIRFKGCHGNHFVSMLEINDNELEEVADNVYISEYTLMPKEEFYEYFFEFLKEYELEEYFDKLVTGRKIFERDFCEEHRNPGNVIYDPTKKRASVVLTEFEYTVPYLLTMGHELGHIVDLNKLNKKQLDTYMKYSYSSVYGEVISSVFEKLFYDFLFRKQYRLDEIKEIYSEFLFENKNYVLDGYLLSLLDDQTIRRLAFNGVSVADVLCEVRDYFVRADELAYHLGGRILSTWSTPLYVYGDYFSTILKDNIQKQGFDSKMMKEFMEFRTGKFEPFYLNCLGFDITNYQKIYKKDISRLKN